MIMNSDLSLKIILFLYFLIVYIFSILRYKSVNKKNIFFFKSMGKLLLTLFFLFLCAIMAILLNLNIPIIYEYIKF